MSIRDKLRRGEGFSASEKELAAFILDHKDEVLSMSVQELASRSHTSMSTVVRLCQKMGLQGYKEFRVNFSGELQRLGSNEDEQVDADFPMREADSVHETSRKIFLLGRSALEDAYQKAGARELQRAVELIAASQHVAVFAWGNNYPFALDFQNKMLKIGRNVLVSSLPMEEAHLAMALEREDCAIVISYSGTTKDGCVISKLLKENGIKTIAITAAPNSPIAKNADIVLENTDREDAVVKFLTMGSGIGLFYILNAIYACLFNRNYQENARRRITTEGRFAGVKTDDVAQLGKRLRQKHGPKPKRGKAPEGSASEGREGR